MKTNGNTRRPPDRAGTEEALMEAALRIVNRDGILAGLNMAEVAEEAGVNRGLIHRYFGSRRDLLRSAVDWAIERATPSYFSRRGRSPLDKGARHFRQSAQDPSLARLLALLALDGDEDFEPITFGKERLEDIAREVDEGLGDARVKPVPILVLWDSTILGYSLIRRAAAKQFDMSVTDLDRQVSELLTSTLPSKPRATRKRSS